jgi:hypothetical protein
VVVVGLGDKGIAFVQDLRATRTRTVAIERAAGNTNIVSARESGAITIVGDARDPGVLVAAGVHRAGHLVIVADDATNAEVAAQAIALERTRSAPALACLLHVVDPDLSLLLRLHEIRAAHAGQVRVEFFNVYYHAARMLLSSYLDAGCRTVVIGASSLAERFVINAVDLGETTHPTDVTLVDERASMIGQRLRSRWPVVAPLYSLTTVDAAADALPAETVLPRSRGRAAVFVCCDDDARSLEIALRLRSVALVSGSRVVLCLGRSTGLAALLETERASAEPLRAVSLAEVTCTHELVENGVYELLARATHAEYVRARASDGDPATVPWEELPETLKEANRAQAQHIGVKLARAGCDLIPLEDSEQPLFEFTGDEIEDLARLEHDRWCAERRAAGFRLGPERDLHRRTTPYLVPWASLPEDVRDLDRNVVRTLPSTVAKAGFQIVRLVPSD